MTALIASALIALSALSLQAQQPRDDLERFERMLESMGMPMLSAKEVEERARAASAYPLGSMENPVRANMPEGQRAYLQRLRCANGRTPQFSRAGSMGIGIYDNVVDLYEVDCGRAQPGKAEVYMDMYHRHVELEAPPGFTINAPRQRGRRSGP